jgi:hypothetical protein
VRLLQFSQLIVHWERASPLLLATGVDIFMLFGFPSHPHPFVMLLLVMFVISIELHAPTSSTQKLKLIGKGGQITYTPTLPLTCRLPQAAYVEYWSGL